METHVAVPLRTTLFVAVVERLRASDDGRDPVDVVNQAVEAWLKADAAEQPRERVTRLGYQWKGVFLADGTDLRMLYKNEYRYAKVLGDQLIYEGRPTSPGSLTKTIAKSSRNAWRDLWIRRPGESDWHLAADIRLRSETDSKLGSKASP